MYKLSACEEDFQYLSCLSLWFNYIRPDESMTDSFPFYSLLFIFNNHHQICETLGSQRPSPGVFRTHRDTHAELSTRQISKVPIWSLSHFLQLFVALTEQRRMVDSFQQGHLTVYLPQWPALSLPAARIILESASRCMFVCVWPLMTHTRCCFRLSTTTDCD